MVFVCWSTNSMLTLSPEGAGLTVAFKATVVLSATKAIVVVVGSASMVSETGAEADPNHVPSPLSQRELFEGTGQ